MKKTLQILIIFTLVSTFSFVSVGRAEPGNEAWEGKAHMSQEKKEKHKEYQEKMRQELGITDEQHEKLEAHRKAHRAESKENREAMKALKDEMKAELAKENFDVSRVRSLHEQIKEKKNQMADKRLEGMLELRETLTAKQFQKFMEMKEKKGKKWGKMRKDHERDNDSIE